MKIILPTESEMLNFPLLEYESLLISIVRKLLVVWNLSSSSLFPHNLASILPVFSKWMKYESNKICFTELNPKTTLKNSHEQIAKIKKIVKNNYSNRIIEAEQFFNLCRLCCLNSLPNNVGLSLE